MKLRNLIVGAAAALFAVLFAGSAMAAYATGAVNVRTGPGTQFGIVSTLQAGQQVNVQTCQGGWCYVTYNGPPGWVSGRYLADGYTPPRYQPQPPRPPVYRHYPPRQQPSVNFSFGVPGFSFSIGGTQYRPWHQWYRGCIRQYGQIYCPVR